jgi:hypothetical protein
LHVMVIDTRAGFMENPDAKDLARNLRAQYFRVDS